MAFQKEWLFAKWQEGDRCPYCTQGSGVADISMPCPVCRDTRKLDSVALTLLQSEFFSIPQRRDNP